METTSTQFGYTSRQCGDITGFATWDEAWRAAVTFAQENNFTVWVFGPYERGDLKYFGRDEGIHLANCHPFQAYQGAWWSSFPECIDYSTGTERELSLHMGNVTNATLGRIHRYLNRKPVLGGNCK